MIYIIPFIISSFIGASLFWIILPKDTKINLFLFISTSIALGLGISGILTFVSFWILNQKNSAFIIGEHIILLTFLGCFILLNFRKYKTQLTYSIWDIICFIVICSSAYLLFLKNQIYPYGGWDAWAHWNTKARFLFLGGPSWSNMLNPQMELTNPSYPFLLPLINVWGWCFGSKASIIIPQSLAIIFSILCPLVTSFATKEITKNSWGLLSGIALISFPLYYTLAGSQYSDIVVALYLLLAVTFTCIYQKSSAQSLLFITGISLGLLSFTKSEGLASTIIILFLILPNIIKHKNNPSIRKSGFYILVGLLIGILPTIIFKAFYSPENDRFINGFISSSAPVSWERTILIIKLYFQEFITAKWSGIWIAAIAGILLSWNNAWNKHIRIIPLYIGIYACLTILHYIGNTYYEAEWWMNTSVKRVIFSFLPLTLFWVFTGLFNKNK